MLMQRLHRWQGGEAACSDQCRDQTAVLTVRERLHRQSWEKAAHSLDRDWSAALTISPRLHSSQRRCSTDVWGAHSCERKTDAVAEGNRTDLVCNDEIDVERKTPACGRSKTQDGRT